MSSEFTTLYVTHSTRHPRLVADSIAAMRWASAYRAHVVLVTTSKRAAAYADVGADTVVLASVPKSDWLQDFNFNAGIAHALDNQIRFDQIVCLRDTALCINRDLDRYVARHLQTHDTDLFGVVENDCYAENFLRTTDLLAHWHVPHDAWETAPSTFSISSASFALSARFARELLYANLLLPDRYHEWPLSYSCYMSWLCQMLHFHIDMLGSVERPDPPFYVTDDRVSKLNPSPHILHPKFLTYYCVQKVRGYSERLVREWAAKKREHDSNN